MTGTHRPRRLLYVVTGGIAAADGPMWTTVLREHFRAEVRVVLTRQASTMVSTRALSAISGQRVHGPDWDDDQSGGAEHVRLAGWADAVLVFPATLNFCAKLAAGICDDLATSVILSARVPVVLAPSLPTGAVNKPATRRILHTLHSDGYVVASPGKALSVTSGEVEEGGAAPMEELVRLLALHGLGSPAPQNSSTKGSEERK